MIEFTVTENLAEQRLDKVLKKILREAPDSFIYRMLREKNITLNKKRAEGSVRTQAGDVIRFFFSDETYRKMCGPREEAEKGKEAPGRSLEKALKPLPDVLLPTILYEDADVLLFVKPSGLRSQKAAPEDYSANDWVLDHFRKKHPGADGTFRPSVVNRLDRNTGGIMASGMSMKGLRVLSELFRDRGLGKYYFTIVSGRAPEEACEKAWIMKLPGENKSGISFTELSGSQPIETRWKRLQYDTVRDLSLLDVELVTGKRHQIRAHLSALGHPVLGDPKYGDPLVNRAFGLSFQCLFCHRISFPECAFSGVSGKTFSVPAPVFWPLRPEGGES